MNANETSTLDTPEQNQTQSLIAAMELLCEIKTEVLEISNTKDSLKEKLQILEAFTKECKEDIAEQAQKHKLLTKKKIRLLKNLHLYRSLGYQEIFVDSKDTIIKYGAIFMNGHGSTYNFNGSSRTQNSTTFSQVMLPSDVEFIEVFGGPSTFYAIPKEGNFLYVWGTNVCGCAGVGHTQTISIPIKVDMPSRVLKIVCGKSLNMSYQSVLALCENGRVYVAGANNTGQLGINNTLNVTTWSENPYLSNIQDIFLASTNSNGLSLCIDASGNLYTFGHNAQGACGNNTTQNVLLPHKLTLPKKVIKAKASLDSSGAYSTSLVLLEDGSLYGAGYNGQKQLSQDNTTNSASFIKLDILNADNEGFIDIYPASYNGTCFGLKEDGRLFAFGYGGYGFGDSDMQKSQIAREVAIHIESLEYSDTAYTRLIARTKSDVLLAFGYNQDGSLGIGNTQNTTNFTKVMLPNSLKDYMLYDFNNESFLVVLCEDRETLRACGNSLDSTLRQTTSTLQAQN